MKNIIFDIFFCSKSFLAACKKIIYFGSAYPPKYIIFEEEKLIYIPISKCWNTSIKTSLAVLLWGQNHDMSFDYAVHGIKFPEFHKLCPKHLNGSYLVFTVVRDPWQRLISCYHSKYHEDLKKIQEGKHLHNHIDFYYYLFWFFRRDSWFASFLQKILFIPRFFMESHFKPMVDCIWIKDLSKVLILDLDNLESQFEPIRAKFNLPTLRKLNSITVGDKNIGNYNLSASLLNRLKNKYRDDFDLYMSAQHQSIDSISKKVK